MILIRLSILCRTDNLVPYKFWKLLTNVSVQHGIANRHICIKIKSPELSEAKYFFVAIFVKEFTEYISMLSFEHTS